MSSSAQHNALGPLRVLQIHCQYLQPGGEESAVASERWMLQAHGVEVESWVVRNHDFVSDYSRPGIAIRTLWNPKRRTELATLLDESDPFDVAHVHNTFPGMSPSVFAELHARRVPVVHTLHNFRHTCVNGLLLRNDAPCQLCVERTLPIPGVRHACYHDSRLESSVMAVLISGQKVTGYLARNVDTFIALSEFSRDIFVRAGLPADRIEVKPNVCSPMPHEPPQHADYFLFVGRLSGEKGVRTLVEAWEAMPDPPALRVIGDGPLRDFVNDRLGSRVDCLGRVDRETVFQHLRGARALIVPSIAYENCPMTVIEAASVSVPAVVSGHGSLAEMVDDGVTGWHFPLGDVSSLIAQVQEVWRDPQGASLVGAGAHAKYLRMWAPGANHAQLQVIYARAIDRSSARGNDPS